MGSLSEGLINKTVLLILTILPRLNSKKGGRMIARIAMGCFCSVLLFCNFSFAAGVASEETATYYREALEKQKKGDLYSSMSSYDKALLTDRA
jgi:hypothetical protein